MKRREFLKRAAALSAFPGTLFAETRRLVPGIQLYAVREPLAANAAATLVKLRSIGYAEVEAFVLPRLKPAALRTMVADAGLRMPSAHISLGMTNDLGPAFAYAKELRVEWAVSSFFGP